MLKIHFEAETPNDKITPINVASSLIESNSFYPVELNEIAEHLIAYTKRIQLEEKWAGIDI